ncbi:MAG TPA: hypothetical protein VHI13_02240 [Candidatus Kapabacteria bacterium]|nr:hypothetical protein [Candidatus Kapabacteria bacterium]
MRSEFAHTAPNGTSRRSALIPRACAIVLAAACVLGGLAASGCISPSDPPGSELDGCWRETHMVIGSSLMMDLTHGNTGITGTGYYSIEAGRSGTLNVTGERHGAVYTLHLTRDYGETETLQITSINSTTFTANVLSPSGTVAVSGLLFQRCP